jgi:hypothetical protein
VRSLTVALVTRSFGKDVTQRASGKPLGLGHVDPKAGGFVVLNLSV